MEKRKEQFYESPQIKVFVTKSQSVLCASNESIGRETGGWEGAS